MGPVRKHKPAAHIQLRMLLSQLLLLSKRRTAFAVKTCLRKGTWVSTSAAVSDGRGGMMGVLWVMALHPYSAHPPAHYDAPHMHAFPTHRRGLPGA
jgi:hypothetical protein